MKHIQKFNEAKKKNVKNSQEILEDKFTEFIEKIKELGEYAHWEFKSGDGVSDKDSAFDVISSYGEKIKELNSLFDDVKVKIHKEFD
jgi:hypothetical protein